MPLGKPLLDTLDRMGYGGLILDTAGQVIRINDTAQRLLRANSNPGHHNLHPDWRGTLKSLLQGQGAARFTLEEDAWVAIPRTGTHGRPLILRAVPITDG